MMDIKYTEIGGYQAPCLELEESGEAYGKYGMLRRKYLKEHRKGMYAALLTQGKLTAHLAETDRAARAQVEQAVEAMKMETGVTEELKARAPMDWTGRMNALKHQAEEQVMNDLIYN